jgi:hypothetical protein
MQKKPASESASSSSRVSRLCAVAVIALGGLGWSGCATQSAARFSPQAVAAMSPAAEVVQPFEAMRLGKKYVAEHPGTEFLVGSGDSMLPLYKDHTVVVTQQVAVANLKAGMTAVYFGDSGRPVAHVLVRLTSDGWIAQGVGNARCDDTRVTKDNLLGVVVKAFEPTTSPMLALLNEAASKSSVASMP